jgi:phosphatidylglycerol---prolipoprotein diacylglyceryl transferase
MSFNIYSSMLVVAVFVAWFVWTTTALKRGWIRSPMMSPAPIFIVLSFFGANTLAIVAEWDRYGEYLFTMEGPMAIQGAMLTFIASSLVFAKVRGLPALELADLAAVCLAWMVIPIRIGCHLQGCCFGKETSLPWALETSQGAMIHPTQMYSVLLGVGLIAMMRRIQRSAGCAIAWFLLAYGIGRALIELMRNDTERLLGGMTYPQVIALGMATAGMGLLLRARAGSAAFTASISQATDVPAS